MQSEIPSAILQNYMEEKCESLYEIEAESVLKQTSCGSRLRNKGEILLTAFKLISKVD